MKTDITINLISDILDIPSKRLTVAVDNDYCEDYDDVIQRIEEEVWEKYGKSLHFGRDFELDRENEQIICDMFSIEDDDDWYGNKL